MDSKKINFNVWNDSITVDSYSQVPHLSSFEQEQISFFKPGSLVLDLGCGTGRTTVILDKMGFKVLGTDYSKSMIERAKMLYSDLKFLVMDAAELEFPDNSFDNILFSFNGIDYIYPEQRRVKAIKEIFRVLKPGGYFAFSSHNAWMIPCRKRRLVHFLKNLIKGRAFSKYRWDYQDFGNLLTYYGSIRKQTGMLAQTGFISIKALGGKKYKNIFMAMFIDPHICYICRKP